MGIFSKIKRITKSSHFSICWMEKDEVAIDLWDKNQTYKINLKSKKVYFDAEHSDEVKDKYFVKNFVAFLEQNKDDII